MYLLDFIYLTAAFLFVFFLQILCFELHMNRILKLQKTFNIFVSFILNIFIINIGLIKIIFVVEY